MFNNKKFILIFSWISVISWFLLIYHFSAQPAINSNNFSIGISESIIENVEKVSPNKVLDINKLNHLIRKNAHFFIYLVLAFLVLNAFKLSRILGDKKFIIAFCICFSYAVIDEFHQLYVEGRVGQAKDVYIDSVGIILGLSLNEILVRIINSYKTL